MRLSLHVSCLASWRAGVALAATGALLSNARVATAQVSDAAAGARATATPRGRSWCAKGAASESAAQGCELAMRYLWAELDGFIWTGSSAPGDSAGALGVPAAVGAGPFAHVGIEPRPCAVGLSSDTLTVLVQYGQVGDVENDNTAPEYSFGPVPHYRRGQYLGDFPPHWAIRAYQAIRNNGEWHLMWSENLPHDPVVGLHGAVRAYRGHHLPEFRHEMERAAAGLRRKRRPACPGFAAWQADSVPSYLQNEGATPRGP